MKELLVATSNMGKLKEIEALCGGTLKRMFSLVDFPAIPEVIEDGTTFAENAIKKGCSAARATGKPALADDSGLIVDALEGRPGIFSARFAGEGASDVENNAMLLKELAETPDARRTAAFYCVVALCFPDGTNQTFKGELKGSILKEPRGTGGFGYDPLFMVSEYGLTLAELPLEIKNRISHRGRALKLLLEFLHSTRC